MKKLISLSGGMALLLALSACSSSSSSDKSPTSKSDDSSIESVDDLPSCKATRDGEIMEVEGDGSYACVAVAKEWFPAVETEDDLPKCNEKREGRINYIIEDEETVMCSDGGWDAVDPTDSPKSSNSKGDDEEEDDRSSSSKGSSKPADFSDLTYDLGSFSHDGLPKLDMWNGWEGVYQVPTGVDNGTETSGYWWGYSDNGDGGESIMIWPVSRGNEHTDDAMDPVIDYCGGICASFGLSGEVPLGYNPFVGVGFNVAGTVKSSSEPSQADVSSWEGLCVTYESSHDITVELGLGTNIDKLLHFDNPVVNLPAKTSPTSQCFKWSAFKQAGWGIEDGGKAITGDEAASILASIKFKIQDKDGTRGSFNIISIGTYAGSN